MIFESQTDKSKIENLIILTPVSAIELFSNTAALVLIDYIL